MDLQSLADALGNEIAEPLGRDLYEICQQTATREKHWYAQRSTDPAKMWIKFKCRDTHCAEQGWKLHIAADTLLAAKVLRRVLPVTFKASSLFKVVVSLQALTAMNQGIWGGSQVGKFITIYP